MCQYVQIIHWNYKEYENFKESCLDSVVDRVDAVVENDVSPIHISTR